MLRAAQVLSVLLIPATVSAQDVKCTLPDKFTAFPNGVGIEYRMCHDLPAKLLQASREPFNTKVELKNTNAAAAKLMLCIHGKTVKLRAAVDTRNVKIELTRDKQFVCSFADQPSTPERYGNIGCQMTSVAAGGTATLVYTTGHKPLTPVVNSTVVQDGKYRKANGVNEGQARAGAGHKVAGSAGTYEGPGAKPLQDVIDKFVLHLFALKRDGVEMACMKKADVNPAARRDGDPDVPYDPPCAIPVASNQACNKCFGMDARFIPPKLAADNLDAAVVTAETTFRNQQPPKKPGGGMGGLMNHSIRVEPGVLPPDPSTCSAVATVTYTTDPSIDPLRPCDPRSEGCFGISEPTVQPFPALSSSPPLVVLGINFPPTTSSSFTADFTVDIKAAGSGCGVLSGQVLQRTTIVYRPQLVCDVTGDDKVNLFDIALISSLAGTTAGPGSPFDPDGNGLINVLDARACVLKCSKPGCAE